MRPAHETTAGHSPTPIFDRLYAEYRRSFRTLPGDRSGEEDLGFQAFGPGPTGGRGLAAVSHTPYPGAGWAPYPVPRAYVTHHPAALPPAPRGG
ncbi:hypothetical protein [Streptomyces sp. NPDC020965]|uniref:hypothetical protein n=1 Tax=Streptomyces sp. NPDC020965 TaxID=3365105 RepID=UPI0037A7BC3B